MTDAARSGSRHPCTLFPRCGETHDYIGRTSLQCDDGHIGSGLTVPEGIVYCALRYQGTELLGIQFTHRGKEWRTDTVEEALALRRRLEEEDCHDDAARVHFGEDESDPDAAKIWTPDVVTDLLENAGDLQRRFIRMLSENQKLTSEELVKKLRLDSEVSLAGVLSGLSKQLKKMDIQPSQLYGVVVSWEGKDKTRTFGLIRQFKLAANQLGWPENWPDKRKGDRMPPPPMTSTNSESR